VAGSSSEIRAAAGLIALATGSSGISWPSLPWRDVAALAVRERCAALAWLRSADIISRYADGHLTSWWRDLALRTLARGHAHVEVLAALTRTLSEAGVTCVMLKGAPLSTMLYGEPGARASADLDVWIPSQDRHRAREVILAAGWRHAEGEPPHDEAFSRPGPHGDYHLEVHGRLLHSRLDYLPLPDPEWASVAVGDHMLPVMTGPLLPAYLAVQFVRHPFAPAVWLLDHRTLWNRLDGEARELARWTARRCGLHRYLDWVLRRADMLDRAMHGEPAAVTKVGLRRQRHDTHPMWRQIRLAPSPSVAIDALRAWVLPEWATASGVNPVGIAQRVGRHWRAAIGSGSDRSRRSNAAGVPARDVTVAGERMLRIARDVSLVGGRMWITTTGSSMHPTLLEGDRVLLEAPGKVGVGDIALLDSGGSPMLHRIVRMRGDQVHTRGDARLTPDAILRRGDIIARAVRARRGNAEWSLRPSSWQRLYLRLSSARRASAARGMSHAHV